MPRKIDQQSLDIISNREFARGAKSLLDTTLATLSNKRQMEEHNQMSQMRTMQIQQAGNELMEWDKQANLRDLTLKANERTKVHALKNLDANLEMQQQGVRDASKQSFYEGQKATHEIMLNANSTDAFNRALSSAHKSGHVSSDFVQKYRGADITNPKVRKAIQNEVYPDYESWAANQAALAKGGAAGKGLSTATPTSSVEKALEHSGFDAAHSAEIAATAAGIKDILNKDYHIQVHQMQIANMMAEIYNADPNTFSKEEAGLFMGDWGQGNKVDTNKLQAQVIQMVGQHPDILSGYSTDGGVETMPTNQSTGKPYTRGELAHIARNNGISVEDLIGRLHGNTAQ